MPIRKLPENEGASPHGLDRITGGWDFDPADETLNVRLITSADGAQKIQLRIRFGLLELFADGAPETGGESQLDEINRDLCDYRAKRGSDKGFQINDLRSAQVSQEIMDYYQRRVCLFLLGDYPRAVRDAEHNLDLMRLLKKYSVDPRTVESHDKYRPFVLMDRARAGAMIAMEHRDFDRAMAEIDDAISAIEGFYKEYGREDLRETSNEIDVLRNLKMDLRSEYCIPPTDVERLQALRDEQARAITREDYERAARIRDEIQRLEAHGQPKQAQ
jgi:hypothetical protein